jgi:hypothetical protein
MVVGASDAPSISLNAARLVLVIGSPWDLVIPALFVSALMNNAG